MLLSSHTARYLMKSLAAVRKGEPLAGLTAGLAYPIALGRATFGLTEPSAHRPSTDTDGDPGGGSAVVRDMNAKRVRY